MNNLYKDIDRYYTNKIQKYGATPKGVDWNGEESQTIRFEQLSKVVDEEKFSLADIGCGYGKYCEYLEKLYTHCLYYGYDISKEMIQSAKNIYDGKQNISFINIDDLNTIKDVDYSISSGIFSVKMQYNESQWIEYILETLDIMNAKSKKGFAFNMLTKYSDKEYMRENLYYADPLFFFDYCKRNFAKNVSLLHDYTLYEFTIIVRKT